MPRRIMRRILITGASGQIGSEMTPEFRKRFGRDNVVASDVRSRSTGAPDSGPFELLDVTERDGIRIVVEQYDIDTVVHLAAILSAAGEKNPSLAWRVNMDGTYNVLEVAREMELMRVFFPSSIAAFGPETPKDMTPQDTVMRPTTVYGVTKVAGELLCDYYYNKFKVDVRGIRFPGIISSEAPPGGGTTDYSVEMFYHAVMRKPYVCFVRQDTVLPMMYMPDCLKATFDLLEVDLSRLKHHAGFNVAAISFSAAELAADIRKHVPEFRVEYKPDFRQGIADSWPRTIDDSAARAEWGWKPSFNLASMTKDVLKRLETRHKEGHL